MLCALVPTVLMAARIILETALSMLNTSFSDDGETDGYLELLTDDEDLGHGPGETMELEQVNDGNGPDAAHETEQQACDRGGHGTDHETVEQVQTNRSDTEESEQESDEGGPSTAQDETPKSRKWVRRTETWKKNQAH